MDVEGQFDSQDRNHDQMLFTLAALTSNVLIYNSKTCNASDLSQLHLSSQITNSTGHTLSSMFIWAIRDFTLMLEKKVVNPQSGEEEVVAITADEYLEQNLSKDNADCRGFKELFRERRCFTFSMPVEQKKKLKDLEKMSDEHLCSEFLEPLEQLKSLIKESDKTWRNGAELAEFIQKVFESVQNNSQDLGSLYENFELHNNWKALNDVFEHFQKSYLKKIPNLPCKY